MVELDDGPARRLDMWLSVSSTSRKFRESWLPAKLSRQTSGLQTYIDVMHEQIGDSLAESEREVVVVIEQIDTLNAKTSKQRSISHDLSRALRPH